MRRSRVRLTICSGEGGGAGGPWACPDDWNLRGIAPVSRATPGASPNTSSPRCPIAHGDTLRGDISNANGGKLRYLINPVLCAKSKSIKVNQSQSNLIKPNQSETCTSKRRPAPFPSRQSETIWCNSLKEGAIPPQPDCNPSREIAPNCTKLRSIVLKTKQKHERKEKQAGRKMAARKSLFLFFAYKGQGGVKMQSKVMRQ